jgi:hypothetical protein
VTEAICQQGVIVRTFQIVVMISGLGMTEVVSPNGVTVPVGQTVMIVGSLLIVVTGVARQTGPLCRLPEVQRTAPSIATVRLPSPAVTGVWLTQTTQSGSRAASFHMELGGRSPT